MCRTFCSSVPQHACRLTAKILSKKVLSIPSVFTKTSHSPYSPMTSVMFMCSKYWWMYVLNGLFSYGSGFTLDPISSFILSLFPPSFSNQTYELLFLSFRSSLIFSENALPIIADSTFFSALSICLSLIAISGKYVKSTSSEKRLMEFG
ncbi:hypothetical protein SDC9_154392 [bioreactor metagenome]|uniref:Uncharacterized protein n=1 Tax=bioreactor metagenome TaxID=1076179 RepID=A0A645F0B9_9ZZZZ